MGRVKRAQWTQGEQSRAATELLSDRIATAVSLTTTCLPLRKVRTSDGRVLIKLVTVATDIRDMVYYTHGRKYLPSAVPGDQSASSLVLLTVT